MSIVDTIRTALYGLPPSQAYKPSKEGVIDAFEQVVQSLTVLSGGVVGSTATIRETLTLLTAVSPADDTLGLVYDDPDPDANGIYHRTSGAWVFTGLLGTGPEGEIPTPQEVGSGKNLYDPSKVATGKEVFGDGTIAVQANSVTSGLIFVAGYDAITIDGLQAVGELTPNGVFLEADGLTPVADVVNVAAGGVATTLAVPADAIWFRFSPKQRNAAALNDSAVQVEYGYSSTAYEAFRDPVVVGFGAQIVSQAANSIVSIGSRNLFNPDAIEVGKEVDSSGSVVTEADSVITRPIRVPDDSKGVYVSGLQSNGTFERRYRWQTSTGSGLGGGVFLEGIDSGNSGFVPKPDAADAHLIFTLRQRNAVANDFANVQIEVGGFPTPKQAYAPAIAKISGIDAGYKDARWAGLTGLIFGDSKAETSDVDAGNNEWDQLVDGAPYRGNWSRVAVPELWMKDAFNYAKTGASFNNSGTGNQEFQTQIANAVSDSRDPDLILVDLGTNDLSNLTFGTYTAAMAENFEALDMSVTMEAARFCFHEICAQWPAAVKFYITPPHRADVNPDVMTPLVNELVKMAKRYGFIVIDAFNESGIVFDFEVDDAQGANLYDGLHPDFTGWIKLGRYIAARVRSYIG